jgi:hypothetical protein
MKLPDITQQPVGEYALGNIPVPRKDKMGDAIANLGKTLGSLYATVQDSKKVAEVDEASGEAAKELSELKAILISENTVDADWVGDDALGEIQISTTQNGERETDTSVKMFTHEIADELWKKRSSEIVAHHAGTISNASAREKFIGEMNERYVAPGTGQVLAANVTRARAYSQAQAERAVELILASDAPSEVRESNAKEIISRQILLGADPVWAEKQIKALGPAVDQMEAHIELTNATSIDALDQIEEEAWSGNNRMNPAQLRGVSTEANARRREFKAEKSESQTANADALFGQFVEGSLSNQDISSAVTNDAITKESGWVLYNALNKGGSTTATDPFTVSRYQGAIMRLQYTGNNMGVAEKGKWLKRDIAMASMGLDRMGNPTGVPATVSGTDALKLNKDIDAAVRAAVENDEYDNALKEVLLWTRSKLDLEGQIVTTLGGNQNQVEAASAFKNALDDYMNQFGVEAKPSEFVQTNKDAYDPRNFSSGINGRFYQSVTQAQPYITQDNDEFQFTVAQQESFTTWLYDNRASVGEAEYNRISALFSQFYLGRGIPPGGEFMFDPNDPVYWQFQQQIQPRQQDE